MHQKRLLIDFDIQQAHGPERKGDALNSKYLMFGVSYIINHFFYIL
jgi:hypothetical protein